MEARNVFCKVESDFLRTTWIVASLQMVIPYLSLCLRSVYHILARLTQPDVEQMELQWKLPQLIKLDQLTIDKRRTNIKGKWQPQETCQWIRL